VTRARLRLAARRILRKGLAAVEPGRLVAAHLHRRGEGVTIASVTVRPRRLFVVAVGKAAIPMAKAAHRLLGERLASAIVIAPSRAPRLPRTRSFLSGHPVPDEAGVKAAECVIDLLEAAGRGDVVLLLLSGGASALMPAPILGVSLEEKQSVTRALLRRGATIKEMNAVRKRLSRLKGGGFAHLAAPARVLTLAISDVPGDDPGTIGSGPTVEDRHAATLARRTLRKYLSEEDVPGGVTRALERRGGATRVPRNTRTFVIGSGRTFAEAAANEARALGFAAHVKADALRGEAKECGPKLAARFGALRRPACLIATGETVVNVRGTGRGGRNQEVALSAVPALSRLRGPVVLAAFATDGVDGPDEASGGMVDDQTAARARSHGISIAMSLSDNDSGATLKRLGGLLITGPTGTNVADVTLIVG
jgi:glycerate 2-kinase